MPSIKSSSSSKKSAFRNVALLPIAFGVIVITIVASQVQAATGFDGQQQQQSSSVGPLAHSSTSSPISSQGGLQGPHYGTSTGFAGNNNNNQQGSSSSSSNSNTNNMEDVLRDACRQSGYTDSTRNARFFPSPRDAARYIAELENELAEMMQQHGEDSIFNTSSDDEDEESSSDSDNDQQQNKKEEKDEEALRLEKRQRRLERDIARFLSKKEKNKLKQQQQDAEAANAKELLESDFQQTDSAATTSSLVTTPRQQQIIVESASSQAVTSDDESSASSSNKQQDTATIASAFVGRQRISSKSNQRKATVLVRVQQIDLDAQQKKASSVPAARENKDIVTQEKANQEEKNTVYVVGECVAPNHPAITSSQEQQQEQEKKTTSSETSSTKKALPAPCASLDQFKLSNRPTFFKVWKNAAHANDAAATRKNERFQKQQEQQQQTTAAFTNASTPSVQQPQQQNSAISTVTFQWACGNCQNQQNADEESTTHINNGHCCDHCGAPREVFACRTFIGQLCKEGADIMAENILETLCPELFVSSSSEDENDSRKPLHYEPHLHHDSGRGKGCAWVYTRKASDVDLIVNRLSGKDQFGLKCLVDSSDDGAIGFWVWGPNISPSSTSSSSLPSPKSSFNNFNKGNQQQQNANNNKDFSDIRLQRPTRGPKQLLPRGQIVAERPTSMGHGPNHHFVSKTHPHQQNAKDHNNNAASASNNKKPSYPLTAAQQENRRMFEKAFEQATSSSTEKTAFTQHQDLTAPKMFEKRTPTYQEVSYYNDCYNTNNYQGQYYNQQYQEYVAPPPVIGDFNDNEEQQEQEEVLKPTTSTNTIRRVSPTSSVSSATVSAASSDEKVNQQQQVQKQVQHASSYYHNDPYTGNRVTSKNPPKKLSNFARAFLEPMVSSSPRK